MSARPHTAGAGRVRAHFYGRTLAGYAFAMGFLASAFFLHSRGIFFPYWMAEFGVGKSEMSLAVTLTLFTGACAAPLTGHFLGVYPVRTVVLTGCLWLAAGYLALRFVNSFGAFLVVLLVFQSLGWTCVGPLAQTKLMVNWFSRHRGMALGVAIMGISVAGIVVPPLATVLAETLGWRDTYTVYSLILLTVAVPVTWFLVKQEPADVGQLPDGDPAPAPSTVPPPSSTAPEPGLIATYREFLASKAFWSVVLTFGLMNGVYSAMITHLPTYLSTERAFSLQQAAWILSAAGGAAIAGKLVFGYLMDHMNAKATVLFAVTSYFVSTLVFMNAAGYLPVVAAAVLFGLGFGGMVPVRSVLISRLFGVKKFSRVNGLLSFFLAPATFWVFITGWVADSSGSYLAAFQVWAAAFLLAAAVTALIRLPNREDAVD
ncbi:MAG: MFS transporter [Pseudomonadales bacterium]